MNVIATLAELRRARSALARPVGFVPTMGYLHQGHIALVQKARQECASVVVSIFVNPTQFGPREDLAAYPRDMERDLALLEPSRVDLVWAPPVEVMYPADYQTWVSVEEVTKRLEGEVRPGHFRGVATVVAKLFNAVQPDKAYFGQKDAQQVVVIRQMVRDLNFPLVIIVCPTVRESDGLAMSSRNVYLSPDERKAATVLYRALNAGREVFTRGGQDASQLRQAMHDVLATEPLVRVQYVSCAHPETLQESEGEVSWALLSLAVFIGKTRLIDNLMVGSG